MRMLIQRMKNQDKQTLGDSYVYNDDGKMIHKLFTLELPWKNNKNSISCIPLGIYDVVKRNSPKFGDHFHITNVIGRSYILIHQGNYYTDIRGCILVGTGYSDINKDGLLDVINSKLEMKTLNGLLPDQFKLHITNAKII